MTVLFAIGRVAFVLIFIISGAQKLIDMPTAVAQVSARLVLPEIVTPYTHQLETLTGQSIATLIALVAAMIEIGAALMVAINIATRTGAALLILFTIAALYYAQPFWTMTGAERVAGLSEALKNLSLIGGLLVFFVLGPWAPLQDRYNEPLAGRV